MLIVDPIEILKPILKLSVIVLVGKFVLNYEFGFYDLVTLYAVFKIEERLNRADFYITKVVKKEDVNDYL